MGSPPSLNRRFVLASGSPRRRALLAGAGLDFDAMPSGVDEESFSGGRPEGLVRQLARAKAEDVALQMPDAVVLAADTFVVLRGQVLNKPRDAADARSMLARLRNRSHRVLSAVCLIAPGKRPRIEQAMTRVRMRPFGGDEVESWIDSGDASDKAGAYAIQDSDFAPVESYEGCYCNVMGLPLWTALGMLRESGIRQPESGVMPAACSACPLAMPPV